MKILLYIPISLTAAFVSQLKWLRESLDQLGEPYSKVRFHLAVSHDFEGCLDLLVHTLKELCDNSDRYFFHLVDKDRFNKYHYLETGAFRFRILDDSDITIFCDADILFIAGLDELLEQALSGSAIFGVQAQASPFIQGVPSESVQRRVQSNDEWWNILFETFVGTPAPLSHTYLSHSNERCPLYFNAGFLIGPTAVWKLIAEEAYSLVASITEEMISRKAPARSFQFPFQIAMTLAVYKLKVSAHAISPIYNTGNSSLFVASTSIAKSDVRVIHYYGNPLMNYYKSIGFEAMIERVRPERVLDSVSSLLVERYDELLKGLQ
jgi:lipopolysaccharide biosynthesis glycosyltransferase